MISIWQPRYRDRTVLIARYKIPCGQDFKIEITQGAYKGVYLVRNEVVVSCPIEKMRSKSGKDILMRVVPLDKLERIDNETKA